MEAARTLAGRIPRRAAEEAVLQTYLFAGFPAAINGFIALERAWPCERNEVPSRDPGQGDPGPDPGNRDLSTFDPQKGSYQEAGVRWERWRRSGQELCARVYGPWYPRLRARMRELSPELDEWMVVEGYGKTLSRPELSETARELCAVAALAACGLERQLDAHLEGARRLGVEDDLVTEVAREAIRRYVAESDRPRLEARLGARGFSRPPATASSFGRTHPEGR